MAGIVSYGAYIPMYRLSRAILGQVWGGGGKGEKAICNFDEDSITMSVGAGVGALKGTDRNSLTSRVAMTNQECMVFVEKRLFMREIIHEESLEGFVAIVGRGQAKSGDNAASVGINNEDRFAGSVQDYRVRSLFTHAVDRKKLSSQCRDIQRKQPVKVIIVMCSQPVDKSFDLPRLNIVITRGVNQPGQLALRKLP